jgi:hypothetical protein
MLLMSEKVNYLFIVLLVVVALLTGVAGYYLGSSKGNKGPLSSQMGASPAGNAFFDTQTATLNGKVTKVNGKTLTIQNSKNQTQDYTASDRIFITKISDKGVAASPSTDLNSVQLNQNAFVNLLLQDGSYKVVSITYTPATPPATTSTPPPASATGTPRPASTPANP